MTLVFTEVGLPSSTITPSEDIPFNLSSWISFLPISSLPTTPHTKTFPPRLWILFTTFAAPPSMKLSELTSTTGTGASGDIRLTFPHTKWSITRSPMTRTAAFLKLLRIATALLCLMIDFIRPSQQALENPPHSFLLYSFPQSPSQPCP